MFSAPSGRRSKASIADDETTTRTILRLRFDLCQVSLVAKIQWVKYTACGFRNKQNFINAILLLLWRPGLAPSSR